MTRWLPLFALPMWVGACDGDTPLTTLEICADPAGSYSAFATQDPNGTDIPRGVQIDPCGTLELEPGTWYIQVDSGDPTCPVPWEPVEVGAGTNQVTVDVLAGCFDG